MLFILSKVFVYLLYPILWIFLLLLIALFSKKATYKKRSLLTATIVMIVFTNTFLLNQFAHCWDINTDNLKYSKSYSCVILLGGFASERADHEGYFNITADRFIQAVKLKITGKASHILMTGGNASINPSAFSEGNWVKKQLVQFNIPDSSVLIENKSRNTIENAIFSKKVLEQAHLRPPYLLVTSAFHMRRSLSIFKKHGLDVVPYSSNYLTGQEKLSLVDFIPSAQTLLLWNIYIKEVVGEVVNYLKN